MCTALVVIVIVFYIFAVHEYNKLNAVFCGLETLHVFFDKFGIHSLYPIAFYGTIPIIWINPIHKVV